MDLSKRYKDLGDNPRNILEMVEREPEWAANRIQAGEAAEKENTEMKDLLRDIYRITGMNSRASHREQTEIYQRMRQFLGIPGVCRWGAPHMVNDIMVQAIGCRPGETIVSANQPSCPFCGGHVVSV